MPGHKQRWALLARSYQLIASPADNPQEDQPPDLLCNALTAVCLTSGCSHLAVQDRCNATSGLLPRARMSTSLRLAEQPCFQHRCLFTRVGMEFLLGYRRRTSAVRIRPRAARATSPRTANLTCTPSTGHSHPAHRRLWTHPSSFRCAMPPSPGAAHADGLPLPAGTLESAPVEP